eukprot:2555341-Alexandrium_andersonii.AAC.1
MSASLVGSEMCIRDSLPEVQRTPNSELSEFRELGTPTSGSFQFSGLCPVSYTHLTLPTICSV